MFPDALLFLSSYCNHFAAQTHRQGFLAGVLSVQWGVGPGDSERTAEETGGWAPFHHGAGSAMQGAGVCRLGAHCRPGSLPPPLAGTALLR